MKAMLAAHSHELRLLFELFIAVSFWVAAAALAVASVRDGKIARSTIRDLLHHRGVLALLLLCGALPILLALDISYAAPRDIMQDIVSADEMWHGRSLYPFPMTPQIHAMLEAQPVGWSLGSLIPPLRAQEVRAYELAVSQHWVQAHPPFMSLAIAVPERVLGARLTILLMNLLSLGAIPVIVWMTFQGLGIGASTFKPIAIVAVLLCWSPVHNLLRLGQSGLLLALLITAGWYFLKRDRENWAGVAFGLATALKLYPGLLFLYLLFRSRRALAVALATTAVSFGAIGAIAGWNVFAEYAKTVTFVTDTYQSYDSNYSLLAALLTGAKAVSLPAHWARVVIVPLAVALILPVFLTIAFQRRDDPARDDLCFATLVSLMPLLSPISWQHYWVVLILPLIAAGKWVARRSDSRALIAFCGLCCLLSIPEPVYNEWFFAGCPALCLLGLYTWTLALMAKPGALNRASSPCAAL